MQGYRIDPTISQLENVKKLLNKEETILYTYEVVPFDYRIVDYSTPKFYITSSRLFFGFDEGIEVYDLEPLDVSIIGDQPEFNIVNVMMSPTLSYSPSFGPELEKLKSDEKLCRISIMEPRNVPKYFLVRNGTSIQKSFKTWAMMRIINNVKIGNLKNEQLIEMMNGYFSSFNTKTLLYFVFSFLGYVVLKLISGFFLPAIVGTILDYVFGAITVFIVYWLWVSVDRNFKRYERYYNSYSNVN